MNGREDTNILHKEQNVLLDLAAKDAGGGVVGKLVDKREGLDLEECVDGGALILAAVQRLAIVELTQITGRGDAIESRTFLKTTMEGTERPWRATMEGSKVWAAGSSVRPAAA